MYDSLVKIYYRNEAAHAKTYEERYKSPSSVHLGVLIRQFNHKKEYPAFYSSNQEIVLSLEEVYSSLMEFLNILPKLTLAVLNQYALSCIVEEVHSTSDIEGIHSTYRELREILDGISKKSHFSSIMKKYDFLLSGEYPRFESCEDVRNFYDEFNHVDAIAENPSNLLDGNIFRKDGVDVKGASGKTIHRGVEPEEKIIKYLTESLRFLNSEEYPALIRIAVFHYLFVYIHPFYDGNGRTGRFISSSYIAQHLHTLVGLRLSSTIKKNKTKYYRLLKETDAEVNCGDLTPFIEGFLQFIASTQKEMNQQLRHKIKQLERMKEKICAVYPDDEEIRKLAWSIVQRSVFYGSGASMTELMSETGKTRNTLKSKISSMPLSISVRHKTKYYKIDWSELMKRYKSLKEK